MSKTDKQLLVESQHQGKCLDKILKEALGPYRGEKFIVQRASLDLGISDAAFMMWCREYGISIKDYKHPVVSAS